MTTPSSSPREIQQPDILFAVKEKAGVITLNRPKALNALNLSMIHQILQQLTHWEKDPRVEFVIVTCAPDSRAFCAGGDIRSVYEARLQDNWAYMDNIFREEYQMNYLISQYSKPYISLIQGICMGGGMGLSLHGSHRIVTDGVTMAMPEAAIGFFTDVGASYFLHQAPGNLGMCLGLTGEKLTTEDCLYAGFATHYVPQKDWQNLYHDLLTAHSAKEALEKIEAYNRPGSPSPIKEHQSLIDDLFSGKTLEEILQKIENSKHPKAYQWLKKIDTQSPTSMHIIFTLLNKTKKLPLEKCLFTEFRVGQRFMKNYDFFEGVRSILIDKDNHPQWQPRRLQDVKSADIKAYFTPWTGKELQL